MGLFNIAIVENDERDVKALKDVVEKYFFERGLEFKLEVFEDGFDFLESNCDFNLVFIDIDMPAINGMETSKILRRRKNDVLIVFVTNMAQFAIEGYKVNALDFCLKPIRYQDIAISLEKARSILEKTDKKYLNVKKSDEVIRIDINKIYYLQVDEHNLIVVYLDLNDGLVRAKFRGALKNYREFFQGTQLVKINSGCYVNVKYLLAIDSSNNTCTMNNGEIFSVSRANKKMLLEKVMGF